MFVKTALRILALFLLLFTVLSFGNFPLPRLRREGVVEVPQVVHVYNGGFCTGFVISKGIIATAAHCADSVKLGGEIRIMFADGFNSTGLLKAIGNKEDRGRDWALITVDTRDIPPTPLKPNRDALVDLPVVSIGYPGDSPVQLMVPGVILQDGGRVLTSAMNTIPGESGSPLIDASTGEVVGIVVATGAEVPFSKATSIRSIPRKLLEAK